MIELADYPILREGRVIGTLKSAQAGLYTVFTARCEPVVERLRLAVFGAQESAYLGLMLPAPDGKLFLRRRLSRLERSRLPETIRYAAEEGARRPDQPAPPPEQWIRSRDGTLRLVRQGKRYVAIPAERVAAPGMPEGLLREIAGHRYLVFCLGTW